MSDPSKNQEPHGAGTPALAWKTYPQAIRLIASGATARAAVKVALVVGSVLCVVNEGAAIVGGHVGAATWARVAVNYLVPFLVASAGYLAAFRVRDGA